MSEIVDVRTAADGSTAYRVALAGASSAIAGLSNAAASAKEAIVGFSTRFEENAYAATLSAARALSEHRATRDPCRKFHKQSAQARRAPVPTPDRVTATTAEGRAWIAQTAAEARRRGLLFEPVADPYAPPPSAQPPRSGKKDWQPTVV